MKISVKKRENLHSTVKLGDKERFDKEQIGVKEPFPMTKCQFIDPCAKNMTHLN